MSPAINATLRVHYCCIELIFALFYHQVYQEFQIQLTDLTVENLLEQFTLAKHTGLEKPGRWERFIYEKSLQYSPLNRRSSKARIGKMNKIEKFILSTLGDGSNFLEH